MDNKTKQITILALMTAFVAALTLFPQIPMPATNGYVNIGDTMIFVTASVFGPVAGLVAGGLGSSLADLISGYAHWAPFTLVIKGVEGLICGMLMQAIKGRVKSPYRWAALATVISAAFMVTGYFFAGWIMQGTAQAAVASVLGNVMQGVVSVAVASVMLVTTGKKLEQFGWQAMSSSQKANG